MVDYYITGTPLPTMTSVDIRLSHWEDSREPHHTEDTYENLVSFGPKVIHGEIWILSEREIYTGSNHYMFRLYDIERLAGQGSLITPQSPEPQSVAPQASGDGPIKLIKTKVLKINLAD